MEEKKDKILRGSSINKKQIMFVHELIASGRSAASYMKAYKDVSLASAKASAWKLMNTKKFKHVQDYYLQENERSLAEMRERNTISKEKLIGDLMELKDTYSIMLSLANQKVLTDEEEQQLQRLNNMLKGSDITKVNDQLAKLIGAYAPDKVEVKQVQWNIDFGSNDLDNEGAV